MGSLCLAIIKDGYADYIVNNGLIYYVIFKFEMKITGDG